jgi:ABC-2 type transport system ATP-binding protein
MQPVRSARERTERAPRMSDAIVIDRLTCRIGQTVAVHELSLEVRRGEVFGLLGHNGAGKTTTVRALNGVVDPASGRALVLGLDPTRDGDRLRARTAVLTESASVDERLTARETLATFAAMYDVPVREVRARCERLLDVFGLADRGDERVGGFSKGMRQRLALARALLHEPELVFLDEPTAGLDPAATRLLHGLIQRWSRDEGRTVVLCTHNLDEAQALCDRVAVLARGRLLASGAPTQLAARAAGERELRIGIPPDRLGVATHVVGATLPGARIRLEGAATLVVRGGGEDAAPRLAAALVAAGVPLLALIPTQPRLADVYFALQPDTALHMDPEALA